MGCKSVSFRSVCVISDSHVLNHPPAGSPFAFPTGPLPVPDAQSLRILSHDLTVLFETPFTPNNWHNFAVQVDWDSPSLGVYYSTNALPLLPKSGTTIPNTGLVAGPDGQGDFHFGVLKVSSLTKLRIVADFLLLPSSQSRARVIPPHKPPTSYIAVSKRGPWRRSTIQGCSLRAPQGESALAAV